MRQVISSIFTAIRSARLTALDDAQSGLPSIGSTPMATLEIHHLRLVAGGEDGDLPKGGWQALA